MIIACNSCNKKFEIDKSLIPETGRLLQCNSCNHKWFFKNKISVKTIEPSIIENFVIFEDRKPPVGRPTNTNKSSKTNTKITTPTAKIVKEIIINKTKYKKKNILLNLIIVFIILYESFYDIGLFIKDLI
jgi:predicted Zn finger-like uncharacterized protein